MNFEVVEVSTLFTRKDESHKYRRCFFDLEGSLTAAEGCILQLATVITDWDFNIVDADVRYFKTDMEISLEEQKVHGITLSTLEKYAEQMFHEFVEGSHLSRDEMMFISFTTFDVNRINEELRKRNVSGVVNFGVETPSLSKQPSPNNVHFNAYNLAPGKLAAYINRMPKGAMHELLTEVQKFTSTPNFSAHDALYDTLALYHLCKSSYT